jgi:hypothetical protein
MNLRNSVYNRDSASLILSFKLSEVVESPVMIKMNKNARSYFICFRQNPG